ncbi:MAG: hypothetical protein K0S68_551, partial [Candidatus Saccharibacteria bacterium]|nr:hypothetical protein [Candidatus Saccharibacteria bacterium]
MPVKRPRRIKPLHLVITLIAVTALAFVILFARAAGSADINKDSKVDVLDLSLLLSDWGKSGSQADINSSGTVEIADLSILLSSWGMTIVASPSPSTATERWSTLHPFLSSAFSNTSVGSGIITDPNS